ncbi:MAG TPA: hypothetical protein VN515_07675 [Terriglobales bacterium]|nr:hypothetical protein [Terriglobales bacterium]
MCGAAALALFSCLAVEPTTGRPALATERFDRGMALYYGFDFADAKRAFTQAAALDPDAPLPYWGMALADGPNLNQHTPSPAQERSASDALAQARERAPVTTSRERGLVDALSPA